jgi:hypothetical protein
MKIWKFSPHAVRSQLLFSAECSKHPSSCYLTFPQTYLLFQKYVQALPVNLRNRFPGCLICREVSQFLSLTDSFILSCLQVGLNVSDLLYKQLHFAIITGVNIVPPLLFPMNSSILSCSSRDHSVYFLSTTCAFILS